MNLRMTSLATLGIAVLAGSNVQAKDTYSAPQREALGAVDALFAAMAKNMTWTPRAG